MAVDAYRTAPRGATSTTATPLAYSTTSRSPCLQRSTPESSANVETTWSTTWSSLLASGSSYVTSMLSPLMSRTRSTMPSMLPHTRRAGPPLGGTLASCPARQQSWRGGPFGFGARGSRQMRMSRAGAPGGPGPAGWLLCNFTATRRRSVTNEVVMMRGRRILLTLVLAVCVGCSSDSDDSGQPGDVPPAARVGDCRNTPESILDPGAAFDDSPVVDCSQTHTLQTLTVIQTEGEMTPERLEDFSKYCQSGAVFKYLDSPGPGPYKLNYPSLLRPNPRAAGRGPIVDSL